jgi:hypothetical protein
MFVRGAYWENRLLSGQEETTASGQKENRLPWFMKRPFFDGKSTVAIAKHQ